MEAAVHHDLVSIEEYLSSEQSGDVRHEYVGGAVYAMAGGTSDHHQIGLNIAFALRTHLKGRPCKVFVFDFKVRLGRAENDRFYYPDVMVGCDARDTQPLYLRFPKILIEVSSQSTERIDRQEKLSAYQVIETLEEYLIVGQDRVAATLFRRANQWRPETFSRLDQDLVFSSIAFRLPLSAIYDGVLTH